MEQENKRMDLVGRLKRIDCERKEVSLLMNIQMDSLTLKIIDYLWNDAKVMDNLLGFNIHRLVRNFMYKEFQKVSPTFSIQ